MSQVNYIVFLDFDGVLHSASCESDDFFGLAARFGDAIRTVDPTGRLPIVISSMWRYTHTITEIRGYLNDAVSTQILGSPPVFPA